METMATIPWCDLIPNTYRDNSGYCEPRSPRVRRRPKPEAPPVVGRVERGTGEALDIFGLCQQFGCRPQAALEHVRRLRWASRIEYVPSRDGTRHVAVQVWIVP
jgi:hypothetical protein